MFPISRGKVSNWDTESLVQCPPWQGRRPFEPLVPAERSGAPGVGRGGRGDTCRELSHPAPSPEGGWLVQTWGRASRWEGGRCT